MIRVESRDRIEIISFSIERINALITDELRDEIEKVLKNGNSKVIISLRNVKYIDSSGFGCLLSIMKTAKNNYCILKFASPEPGVMELLKTLHLDTVFDIYDDLDQCVRSMR
jgi:anti-sigma B factor antagonist